MPSFQERTRISGATLKTLFKRHRQPITFASICNVVDDDDVARRHFKNQLKELFSNSRDIGH